MVFHVPSGDTHLLERPSGEVLLLLRNGPRDLEGLVRELGTGELAAAVSELLARFQELGVVEAEGA